MLLKQKCIKVWDLSYAGVKDVANDLNTGKISSEEWNAETDIKTISTNAFGKIEFVNEGLGGRKPSKVIVITVLSLRCQWCIFTHSLTHSFIHSLAHSITHSLIDIDTPIQQPIHAFPLSHSPIHSSTPTCPPTHPLTNSLNHSLTDPPTTGSWPFNILDN